MGNGQGKIMPSITGGSRHKGTRVRHCINRLLTLVCSRLHKEFSPSSTGTRARADMCIISLCTLQEVQRRRATMWRCTKEIPVFTAYSQCVLSFAMVYKFLSLIVQIPVTGIYTCCSGARLWCVKENILCPLPTIAGRQFTCVFSNVFSTLQNYNNS